jgi:hypothetical protein
MPDQQFAKELIGLDGVLAGLSDGQVHRDEDQRSQRQQRSVRDKGAFGKPGGDMLG